MPSLKRVAFEVSFLIKPVTLESEFIDRFTTGFFPVLVVTDLESTMFQVHQVPPEYIAKWQLTLN